MRIITAIVSGFLAAIMFGCSSPVYEYNAMRYSPEARAQLAEADTIGLFRADQAVLSNEDIQKIFAARVVPQAKGRLAAIQIGYRSPWGRRWWSEEMAQLEQQATDDLLKRLRTSPRLRDVLLLPAMLTPPQGTIPYLREAAARIQADALLVYRTSGDVYQRSRFMRKDEVRAYCTVEAILLDTRSGLVMTTAVATENFSTSRKNRDLSSGETAARAEQQAVSRALAKVAEQLVAYLNSEPLPAGQEPTTQAMLQ